MTTLAQQIEALRTRMLDSHGDEMYLVARLAADIAQRDAELLTEIEDILHAHEQRRCDAVRALHTLAARIGHVPPIVPPLSLRQPEASHGVEARQFPPPLQHGTAQRPATATADMPAALDQHEVARSAA